MAKIPMTKAEIREMFERDGAVVRDGHFVYASGKHGSVYVNKDILLSDPLRAQRLADELGRKVVAIDAFSDVDAVVGPAMSGIKMSHLVASYLSGVYAERNTTTDFGPFRVLAVYAEKERAGDGSERFMLRRGFDDVVKHRKVLIAEDVVNEATTARRVVETVMAAGGTVAGVVALWNRGSQTEIVLPVPGRARLIKIPIVALVEERLEAWGEDECPHCARDVPFNSLGHATSFLEKKKPV